MSEAHHLKNVIGLKGVHLGFNHVAFAYERHDFDLREYLRNKRDHRQLPQIF